MSCGAAKAVPIDGMGSASLEAANALGDDSCRRRRGGSGSCRSPAQAQAQWWPVTSPEDAAMDAMPAEVEKATAERN
jgi:hypothetical protein